jgi:hypothetical protein
MPGFIDVTGWSKEDVRRLGHMDDEDEVVSYTRNPYAFRKPSVKKPAFSYDSDLVWGAAVVAFRANNGYVKAIAPGTNQITNRQLMEQLLKDNVPLLDSDLEEGRKIRRYFQTLTFKIIEGKQLTPFLQSAMQTASKDQITDNLGLGTIASLPATYEKMTSRDDVERKIKWAQGGFIGKVGDKTKQHIEIIKQIWSQNWGTWYYTGLNKEDQVLFFAYKGVLKIGDYVTIEGKIKSHRDNSTQLSHVKVINNA